jgi:hypothetical protein
MLNKKKRDRIEKTKNDEELKPTAGPIDSSK